MSGAALTVMLAGALLLGAGIDHDGDGDDDLNVRAVLLDTAAGVAITGAVIYTAHVLYGLDPAVALAIVLVVGYQAVRLLSRTRTTLR